MNDDAVRSIVDTVFAQKDAEIKLLRDAVIEWRDASKAMSGLATSDAKSAGITFTTAMRRHAAAEERLMQLSETLAR